MFVMLMGVPAFAAPTISKITAHFIYAEGKVDEQDILTLKKGMLWNTIIGEGAAKDSSESTEVRVYVKGEAKEAKVQLKVKEDVQSQLLPEKAGKDGLRMVKFTLKNTGCERVNLTASISASSVKKTIPFACGE